MRASPAARLYETLGPLAILVAAPIAVPLLSNATLQRDRSLIGSLSHFASHGWGGLWPAPTPSAAAIVLGFALFQAALLVLLPGKWVHGPEAEDEPAPRYKVGGLLAWLVTIPAFASAGFGPHLFSPPALFDQFGPILTVCSIFGFLICCCTFALSKPRRPRRLLQRFFWGSEVHFRVGRYDLKHFVVTRLAMMSWSLILLCFAAKQYELFGRVSSSMSVAVALQLVYIGKFYVWERGYLATLDMMHDRVGFYMLWSCCTWLPCVYTLTTAYLVTHPIDLSAPAVAGLLLLGIGAIGLNYAIDRQRQLLREGRGTGLVWGRPPRLIEASYLVDGQPRTSLLLASGWWGLARHLNYTAEIGLALAWSLAAGFEDVLPYLYVIYLTLILAHRAYRDEQRCRDKYGAFWDQYCRLVPYRLIPGLW